MTVFIFPWRDEQGHFATTHAAEVAWRKGWGGIGGGGGGTGGEIVLDGCVDEPSVECSFDIGTIIW